MADFGSIQAKNKARNKAKKKGRAPEALAPLSLKPSLL
jgi:hypothetical protein